MQTPEMENTASNVTPVNYRSTSSAHLKGAMATVCLVVWTILLPLWLLIAPLAGMAFDGGYTLSAYLFVSFVWTYPISLAVAWFLAFIKKKPLAALIPCVNILGVLLTDLFGK